MYGGMERLDAADMLTAQCTSPKEEESGAACSTHHT